MDERAYTSHVEFRKCLTEVFRRWPSRCRRTELSSPIEYHIISLRNLAAHLVHVNALGL